MLKLHSNCKKRVVYTFLFLIGLIGLKSHPSIIFITFVFLLFNLLKAIEEYKRTKVEMEQVKTLLSQKWEKKREIQEKKSII